MNKELNHGGDRKSENKVLIPAFTHFSGRAEGENSKYLWLTFHLENGVANFHLKGKIVTTSGFSG